MCINASNHKPSSSWSGPAPLYTILPAMACHDPPSSLPLTGEPIATRWTPDIKAEVKRSRVATTRQLAAAINACPAEQRPKVLVNASAVGYYGSSEVSRPGCCTGGGGLKRQASTAAEVLS